MEPIRDAVPQRSLTTTPASTTSGHAPDTHAGPFHGTSSGRQSQTTPSYWAAKVTEFKAIAARLQLEGDERALELVAKTAATISTTEQCKISDALLIRCLHYIFTRSCTAYEQHELVTLFCEYENDDALQLSWAQVGMLQPLSQQAGADAALVFLHTPEPDAPYIAYADSETEHMRGESRTERLAASINPAFRVIRRLPTSSDTLADGASEHGHLPPADGPLGRQDQHGDAQRARCASASAGQNDLEGNYTSSGLHDHLEGLRRPPSSTGRPGRPHSPIVIINGDAEGNNRSNKAPTGAADGTAAKVAPTIPRPQYQPRGDRTQQLLSFTPSCSASVDEHRRATTDDLPKAAAESRQTPHANASDIRTLVASDDFEFGTAHGCQNSQQRAAHGYQGSPNTSTPPVVSHVGGPDLIQRGQVSRVPDIDSTLTSLNAFSLANVSTRARTEASLTNRQQEMIRLISASQACINTTVLHKLALHCVVEFDNSRDGRAVDTTLDQWLLESLQGAAELFVRYPHFSSKDAVAKAVSLHSTQEGHSLLDWLREVYSSKVKGGHEDSYGSEGPATTIASATRGVQRSAAHAAISSPAPTDEIQAQQREQDAAMEHLNPAIHLPGSCEGGSSQLRPQWSQPFEPSPHPTPTDHGYAANPRATPAFASGGSGSGPTSRPRGTPVGPGSGPPSGGSGSGPAGGPNQPYIGRDHYPDQPYGHDRGYGSPPGSRSGYAPDQGSPPRPPPDQPPPSSPDMPTQQEKVKLELLGHGVPKFYSLEAPANAREYIILALGPATYAAQVGLGWPCSKEDLRKPRSAKDAVVLLQDLSPGDGLRFGQARPNIQNTLTRTIAHTAARLSSLYKAMFEINTAFFTGLAELPMIRDHVYVTHFRTMAVDLAELTTSSAQLDRLAAGIQLLDELFFPIYLERKEQTWNVVGFPKLATMETLFQSIENVSMSLWPGRAGQSARAVDKFFELVERVANNAATASTVHGSAHMTIEALRKHHHDEPFTAERLRSHMTGAYSCRQLIFVADRQDAIRSEPRHRPRGATFNIDGHNEREASTAQAAAMQEPFQPGPAPRGASCSPEQVACITSMIGAAYAADGGREGARAAKAAKAAALAAEAEVAAAAPDGKGGRKGGKGSKGKGERLVGFGPNGAIIGGAADVPRLIQHGFVPDGVNPGDMGVWHQRRGIQCPICAALCPQQYNVEYQNTTDYAAKNNGMMPYAVKWMDPPPQIRKLTINEILCHEVHVCYRYWLWLTRKFYNTPEGPDRDAIKWIVTPVTAEESQRRTAESKRLHADVA